jgi:hypothetical protein
MTSDVDSAPRSASRASVTRLQAFQGIRSLTHARAYRTAVCELWVSEPVGLRPTRHFSL